MKRSKGKVFLIVMFSVICIGFIVSKNHSSIIKATENQEKVEAEQEDIVESVEEFTTPQSTAIQAADLTTENASVKNYTVSRAALPPATNTKDVMSWTDLIAALNDVTIDRINIMTDLTSGAVLPTISRELVVNGNNHTVNFGARYFNTDVNGKLTISDLKYTGTNTLASGSGTLTLTNQIQSITGNSSAIATMNGATVIFDQVDLYFDSTIVAGAIAAKNFFITNQSKVDSNSERFYQITAATNEGATFTIDKESKVLLSSMKGTGTGNRGQPIQSTRKLDLTVEGTGTELKIRGNGKQNVAYTGLINVDANASTINVLNEALLDIYTENTSGINMQSKGGVFNVKNKSTLTIHQIGDNNYVRASIIRFRSTGDMQFNIEENSKIALTKDSGTAPGIRMYGGGNSINVSSSSDFTLVNKGSGAPSNPGVDGGNQGILYTNGGSKADSFTLKDENSSVDIQAITGAAIDAKGLGMSITAGEGTYFVARGQTSSETSGIFNAGVLTANFKSMKYFDFVNTRAGGGLVFDTSAGSTFVSLQSDISVWVIGVNEATGNPKRSFTLANISLSGANFNTVDGGTDSDVIKGLTEDGGMPKYTRLNGNNQRAVIDELRVPTNADTYIWGHASIPEGKNDGNRDAFTDEVSVIVGVYDSTDTLLYKATGTIVEETSSDGKISIYGEEARAGIFRIDTQTKGSFLKEGQTIKVLEAWRGDKDAGRSHDSTATDLVAPNQTTIDVTPPLKVVISTDSTNATKQIAGTCEENGAKVFAKVNDTWLKDSSGELSTTTVIDGKWVLNLPNYLTKEDKVDIYLKDTTTISIVPTYSLPTTYTEEPDGVYGNLNVAAQTYASYTGYHDAIKGVTDQRFSPSVLVTTKDVIPDRPSLVKSVVSSGGSTTSVGDMLTYSFIVGNEKKDSEDWKNVELIDVIPDGLTFDPAKHKVMVNNTEVGADRYSYDEATKKLVIKIGAIAEQKNITAAFQVTVAQTAADKEIKNTADATGDSPQEDPFVAGPINTTTTHKVISVKSNEVGLPGGAAYGVLMFVSAPTSLDFGITTEKLNGKTIVENPKIIGEPLVVSDNRGNLQKWTMTALLLSPLANGEAIFPDAVHYVNGGSDEVITGLSKEIFTHKNEVVGEYNITEEEWIKKGNGFKIELEPGAVNKLGNYQAKIQFTLSDTP